MNDNIHYVNKMPESSEFNVSSYLSAILIFTFLIIIYFVKFYPDTEILLVFIIVFAYMEFGGRAKAMKHILIKKIDSTIKENSEISKQYLLLSNYLLTDTKIVNSFYKNEVRYFWGGVVLFIILYGIAYIFNNLEILSKYYLYFVYFCVWQTIFNYKRLYDVFRYFQNIKEESIDKVFGKEDLVALQKNATEQFKYFQSIEWHKINKKGLISSIVFFIIVLLFAKFKPFSFVMAVSIGGLVLLGINVVFLSKQLNKYLPLLRDYDDFVKEKYSLIYKRTGYEKISEELKDSVKELNKELNKDIKDIFR